MAWARASSKPGFQNPSKVQRTLGEPWFLQGSDTRMQMRKQTEFKENGGGGGKQRVVSACPTPWGLQK